MLSRNRVAVLDKGMALACEARLDVNVDKLTELAIIMLKEHWEYIACLEKRS